MDITEFPREFRCFCCLTRELTTYISLSKNITENITVENCITYCTGVEINQNRKFPSYVCQQCFRDLQVSYKIKKKSVESYETLLQEIGNVTNKIEIRQEKELEILDSMEGSVICIESQQQQQQQQPKLFVRNDLEDPVQESLLTCEICLFKCSSKQEFRKHITAHAQKERINSSISYLQKRIAKKGISVKLIHRSPQEQSNSSAIPTTSIYQCDICFKSFSNVIIYQNHKQTHIKTGKFECEFCSKVFTFRNMFESHVKGHLKIKSYSCQLCSAQYAQKRTLRRHLKSIHNIDDSLQQ